MKKTISIICFIISCLAYSAFAGNETEKPYASSKYISGINFLWNTYQCSAKGSDNWAVTWADDDKQYATWGDGWGFAESGPKQSLGVSCIEGPVNSYKGTDLWGLPTIGSSGGKSYGILCIRKVLYMWVGPGSETDSWKEQRLYISHDHGRSWEQAPWAFTRIQRIIMPAFLNYGKNYKKARDNYVYTYCIRLEQNTDQLSILSTKIDLARVPRDRILEQDAWEFFTGMINGKPTWNSDIDKRAPVFIDPNGVGWTVSVSYNIGLKRYMLCTEHTQTHKGLLGIFEAPEPWGPWSTVYYADKTKPFGIGHIKPTVFYANFSNKWTSKDGKQFVLLFTGTGSNDAFNLIKGRFITKTRR